MLVKFWIHVSAEEQLKRFKERETNPLKQLEADRTTTGGTAKRRRSICARSRTCSSGPTTSVAPWQLVEA